MRPHAKSMSDLSLPPLSNPDPRSADRASAESSQWAMPPAANAGSTWPLGTSEPCAILGLNDKGFNARLAQFDASTGLATVFVPPARSPMQLRFGQFLHQFKAEALVLLMAEPADLTEDVTLGRQPKLGEEDRRELIVVDELRIIEEPPDQGAFAVIDAAAGDEAQQAFRDVRRRHQK